MSQHKGCKLVPFRSTFCLCPEAHSLSCSNKVVVVGGLSIDNPTVFFPDEQEVNLAAPEPTKQIRDTELPIELRDQLLVVQNIFNEHAQEGLHPLVPEGFHSL